MGTIQNSINQALGAAMGGTLAVSHVLDQVQGKSMEAADAEAKFKDAQNELVEMASSESEDVQKNFRDDKGNLKQAEYAEYKKEALQQEFNKADPNSPEQEATIKALKRLKQIIDSKEAQKKRFNLATPYFQRKELE